VIFGAAGPSLSAAELAELAASIAPPGSALALLGSHARGEAGPNSDVDLLLLVPDGVSPPAASSHLVAGRLVVMSAASESETRTWFEQPDLAVVTVAGLRRARVVSDPHGTVAALLERAVAFTWTDSLERRADRWVGDALAGWAEEAMRGVEGLRRDDPGRLLLARFGLSWGLSRVMVVHKRLLLETENAVLSALAAAMGEACRWVELQRAAFGLDNAGRTPGLREQVLAGLALYRETDRLVSALLSPDERRVVDAASQAAAGWTGDGAVER
jgi:hypothetical protein